jgi:16S rRNA processing protein RimM
LTLERSRVLVGIAGAPHGVKGELRVKSFTEDPLDLGAYGPLETEDGRRLEVESVRPGKEVVVVRLAGVRDRDAAEALKGKKLFVPREKLPPPDEDDEFYHADLIGLVVVTQDGAPLGRIVAVPDFGAGPLLEIAPEGGGATVLLPFVKAHVPEIDLDGGKVIADPPDGLFEG